MRTPGIEKRPIQISSSWVLKISSWGLDLAAFSQAMSSAKRGSGEHPSFAAKSPIVLYRPFSDGTTIQQRAARWVIPDLSGKGTRARTVTIPSGLTARINQWASAVGITEGLLLRPVTKAVKGAAIEAKKSNWRLAVRYVRQTEIGKLAPHDLRHLLTARI